MRQSKDFVLWNKETEQPVSVRGKHLSGVEWQALCPGHDDHNPSLRINEAKGVYCCDVCGFSGRLYDPNCRQSRARTATMSYIYRNADGTPFMEVTRYDFEGGKKAYYPKRFDGKPVAGMTDYVPYNLPGVIKADTVYIPEGEKCADALMNLGLVAATNLGGAGVWQDSLNQYFKDKDIIVFEDDDGPGRRHTQLILDGIKGIASSVKVVRLPGFHDVGDMT